ncbi:NAD(P)H-dependent oxidoreductase [Catenovulum sp. SM1970]|uniref:NAD(P)H-dependent oxidoreductase n=1 Tax=Marinifaba aquimaris TaxID=2741323 RepID=UPI001572EA53|nr:NAD(P)H-dependent oxidoreductase [Marinifaba aquimaris]NTS78033.1 NAD(P)H-dependent oxidoreductase [Marinifaba aquimaris]
MSNVLVISGHPNLAKSNTNQIILQTIANRVNDVEIRKLDQLYPDYQIDVAAEQLALLAADIIVLQFPFYWYSVPALLKKWIDDVFSYDFAYGNKGDKLHNKDLILSFTIGGPKESYDPLGYNHFPIAQLIQPLQQTAYLTGMVFHPPVYSHGMVYIPGVYNELADLQNKALKHSESLIHAIDALKKVDEQYVERFARKWFKAMDKLPKDSEQFTQYLAQDITWSMPEGLFIGHEGFRDWYALIKQQFIADCNHQVQAIKVNKTEQGFYVELTVNLKAQTHLYSSFKGESVDIVVNEKWQLSAHPERGLIIQHYQVEQI